MNKTISALWMVTSFQANDKRCIGLTRIVPNNSAIKDRIIRSNPLVFEGTPG